MREKYSIKFSSKNECIRFSVGNLSYEFFLEHEGRNWVLFVPGSRWEGNWKKEMSVSELEFTVPLITAFLKTRNFLRFFGFGSEVRIKEVKYDARFDDPANRRTPLEFRMH